MFRNIIVAAIVSFLVGCGTIGKPLGVAKTAKSGSISIKKYNGQDIHSDRISIDWSVKLNKPWAAIFVMPNQTLVAQTTPFIQSFQRQGMLSFESTVFLGDVKEYTSTLPNSNRHAAQQQVTLFIDPVTHKINLAGGRISPNRLSQRIGDLSGAYLMYDNMVVGLNASTFHAPSSEYFLLMEVSKLKSLLEKASDRSWSQKLGGNWGRLPSMFYSSLDQQDAYRWSQKATQEYPTVSMVGTGGFKVKQIAYKLMRDDYFKRFFNKTYDEIDNETLTKTVSFDGWDTGSEKYQDSRAIIYQTFTPTSRFSPLNTSIVNLKGYQSLLEWHRQSMTLAEELPPSTSNIKVIKAIHDALSKFEEILLWPSEQETTSQTKKNQLARMANHVLNEKIQMLATKVATTQKALDLMSFFEVNAEESTLLDIHDRNQLEKAINEHLMQTFRSLEPKMIAHLNDFSLSLDGFEGITTWFGKFMQDFSSVKQNEALQRVLINFEKQYAVILKSAEPQISKEIAKYNFQIRRTMSPSDDAHNIALAKNLNNLYMRWFDSRINETGEVKNRLIAEMRDMAEHVAYYIPPFKRNQIGYSSVAQLVPSDYFKQPAKNQLIAMGTTGASAAPKQWFEGYSNVSGIEFESITVWALFHGRFDILENMQGVSDTLATWAYRMLGINPRVDYAFVTYVGLNGRYSPSRQLGVPTQVWWKTTDNGQIVRNNWGKVTMPQYLVEYYESAYKRSNNANITSLFFENGFVSFFLGLDNIREGELFNLTQRADGEIGVGADWSKSINRDLAKILSYYPPQSNGLWQFQENVYRYLSGKPSLQAAYGYIPYNGIQ